MTRYRPRHLDEAWTPPRVPGWRVAAEIALFVTLILAIVSLAGAGIGAWPEETAQIVTMEARR